MASRSNRRALSALLGLALFGAVCPPSISAQDSLGSVSPSVSPVRAERAGGLLPAMRGVRVALGGKVALGMSPGAGTAGQGVLGEALVSRTTFGRELLARLPIDDILHGLSLSPGVVLRGTDIGIASAPSLSIRGSGADQIGVYVDGAPARFETLGAAGIALGTDAISEVSVLTGVSSVVMADTRGGAISYVTRSGGSRLEGGFSATSEGPFGSGTGVGYNRFEGSVGGPAPLVPGLTWFFSAAVHGQPSAYRGAGAENAPTYVLAGVDTVIEYAPEPGQTASFTLPRYAQASGRCGQTGNLGTKLGAAIRANYGFECTGLRRPLDWATSSRGLAKLLYTFGNGSSLSITGLASDLQRRFSPGADINAAGLYGGFRTRSRLAVLNWDQMLGRALGGALALHANLSFGSDEYLSGLLDAESGSATSDPALGIEFGTLRFTGQDIIPLRVTDEIIRNIRTNSGLRVPYQDRMDLNPSQPFRANPYGLAQGWPTAGIDGGLTLVSERRLNGRWLVDWQASREIRLTGGGDLSRTDVAYYSSDLIRQVDLDAFRAQPQRIGLFGAGRLERGDLALEAGVRVDRFRAGGQFPVVPGRIFSNPDWSPDAATDDAAYSAAVARVFAEGRTQTVVSPRVSMASRASRHTTAHVGVGWQAEAPPFDMLFSGVNSDLVFASSARGFGVDVNIVSSSLVEGGIRHVFARGTSLDVSAYSKTRLSPYGYMYVSVFDPLWGVSGTRSVLSATDIRGTGADARLEWRGGEALSGSITYSLLRVMHSALTDVITPEDYSTHSVSGSVSLRVPEGTSPGSIVGAALSGTSADLLFRFTSGLPYTRLLLNEGMGIVTPAVGGSFSGLEENGGARLPWTKVLDLRLAKAIPWGAARLTAFVEVRNLLGTSNLLSAFAETGTDVNDVFRSRVTGPELTMLRNEPPAGAVAPDGTIDLTTGCAAWRSPVNCVALRRVENRFGDGNGLYSPDEQQRALNASYDAFLGAWRFYGPGRTARAGLEVRF